jgi:hypothetical protein
MRVESTGTKCGERAQCGKTAECAEARVRVQMGEAVELLASGWPEDYPVGAVEWFFYSLRELKGRLGASVTACDH